LYPVGPASTPKLLAPEIEAFAAVAYAKNNFALVGNGIEQAELSKWTGEFFKDVSATAPSGLPALDPGSGKYFGGETRIAHSGGSAVTIAFEGSSLIGGASHKPAIDALAALLGGQSAVKWSTGTSILAKVAAGHPGISIKTESLQYSDTGLLAVTITGSNKIVSAAVKDVAAAILALGSSAPSAEDLKKAVAQAKFKAYDVETADAPLLDVIGLGGVAGSIKTSEAALKGISALSPDAVKTVRFLHSSFSLILLT
jgi:ubiquinol-cytochrome c reductase core subunit 2